MWKPLYIINSYIKTKILTSLPVTLQSSVRVFNFRVASPSSNMVTDPVYYTILGHECTVQITYCTNFLWKLSQTLMCTFIRTYLKASMLRERNRNSEFRFVSDSQPVNTASCSQSWDRDFTDMRCKDYNDILKNSWQKSWKCTSYVHVIDVSTNTLKELFFKFLTPCGKIITQLRRVILL